ncbi:MAG: ArnT family glycosyltransferase [Paracoccaceae bacterium]
MEKLEPRGWLAATDKAIRAWAGGPRAVVAAVLAAVSVALFLPGFTSLPPVDRDEASFAQSSRQMAESGDLVDIRLHDAPRHKKPVGIYWMQALAVAATGGEGAANIVTYRAVSLLGAVAAVLLTLRIGTTLAGAEAGAFAGLLMAGTFLLGAEARLAKTDAVLLATVLAMMAPAARVWMGEGLGRGAALGFWAALGLSILIKGPIGPMVVGLALAGLALQRRGAGWLRPIWSPAGLGLALAIVLPWYLAITFRTGWEFWGASLGRDLIGKVAEGQESHGAPPGSYLAAFWLTFWPAALPFALALPAIAGARKTAAFGFCLAWALPTWLIFEAVATKLVHYVLPVYPALAILAAVGWAATAEPLGRVWRRIAGALLLVPPVGAVAAMGIASVAYGGPFPVFSILSLVLLGGVSALFWRAGRSGAGAAALVLTLPLAFALSLGLYPTLARVPALWPSAGLRDALSPALARLSPCGAPVVILSGYSEPSAVFMLGRDVIFAPGAEAAERAAAAPCAVVIVEARQAAEFDARAKILGVGFEGAGKVEGTNLGSGRALQFRILLRKAE